MLEKKNISEQQKKFVFDEELVFWTSFEYEENCEKLLLERFEKIRNEELSAKNSHAIADEIIRIIPENKLPIFLLKLYIELPKKDCSITIVLKNEILTFCRKTFVAAGIDENTINTIGKTACVNKNAEESIKAFINDGMKKLNLIEVSKNSAMSVLYLWLIIQSKEFSQIEFVKAGTIIDKCFVELFRTKKDMRDFVSNKVPKAISNERYEKEFLGLSYLYLDSCEKMAEITQKNDELTFAINQLSDKKGECDKTISELKETKLLLEEKIVSMNKEIENLKEKLVSTENLLKYEKNKYEQQYVTKASSLLDELEEHIGIELQGIEDVAERLPDREREKILRKIKKIRDKAGSYGGDI